MHTERLLVHTLRPSADSAGFGLVNLAASLRSSNTGITAVPPSCATNCGIIGSNNALNLTTSSTLATRSAWPDHRVRT